MLVNVVFVCCHSGLNKRDPMNEDRSITTLIPPFCFDVVVVGMGTVTGLRPCVLTPVDDG